MGMERVYVAFLMRYVGGGLTDAYGISKFAMYHLDVTNPIIYFNQKVLFINAITNFIESRQQLKILKLYN